MAQAAGRIARSKQEGGLGKCGIMLNMPTNSRFYPASIIRILDASFIRRRAKQPLSRRRCGVSSCARPKAAVQPAGEGLAGYHRSFCCSPRAGPGTRPTNRPGGVFSWFKFGFLRLPPSKHLEPAGIYFHTHGISASLPHIRPFWPASQMYGFRALRFLEMQLTKHRLRTNSARIWIYSVFPERNFKAASVRERTCSLW
jgi:hypothetical protein